MKAKRERNLFGAKKRHLLIIIYIKVFYEKEGYIFIIFIHRRCKKACHTDKKSSLLSRFHSKLVRKQDQCLYPSKETFIWQLYPSIQEVFPYSSSPPLCVHWLCNCPFFLIFPQTNNKKRRFLLYTTFYLLLDLKLCFLKLTF